MTKQAIKYRQNSAKKAMGVITGISLPLGILVAIISLANTRGYSSDPIAGIYIGFALVSIGVWFGIALLIVNALGDSFHNSLVEITNIENGVWSSESVPGGQASKSPRPEGDFVWCGSCDTWVASQSANNQRVEFCRNCGAGASYLDF